MHDAMKVVVITERIILDRVAEIIEEKGATGYTYVSAGGKGSRGIRRQNRAHVSPTSANVKIEVIVANREMGEAIADAVADTYFDNYSGITYLEPVEILRPSKFQPG